MTDVQGVSGEYLRQYIERIENLEEEKAGIAEGITEVYAEAKHNGFDVKVMRQIVRLRKLDKNERMELETLIDLYKQALGMEV